MLLHPVVSGVSPSLFLFAQRKTRVNRGFLNIQDMTPLYFAALYSLYFETESLGLRLIYILFWRYISIDSRNLMDSSVNLNV